MAGGVAATLTREFPTPIVVGSPRFLLPRASGACLPPLPSPPMASVITPDLALDGGGIRANSGGWPAAEPVQDLWVQWVAKLRPLHEPMWRELGIREGILATTCCVGRRGGWGEVAMLQQLVPFWSPATNTFVFPWGEATVTLEDAAVLGGLPLAGSPVRENLFDQLHMEDERVLEDQSSSAGGWIEHFLFRQEEEAATVGGDRYDEETLEHGAFLSMWLSHFVLPSPPFGVAAVPSEDVVPIAARLARGQGVALAPAALAGIYSELSALKGHLASAAAAPSISAPMQMILQLWVWEHFPELRPATAAGIPVPAAGDDDVPRGARWCDVVGEALEPGYVRAVFAAPKKFEWRPYGNRAVKSFARCLRPCELVGLDCVEQYSPHRVARQLGFDQDVPGIVTRLNSESWEKAWATYDIGAGYYEFAVPSDKPGVTDEYVQWWKPYSLSCAAAPVGERDNKGKEILGGGQDKKEVGNGDTLASNKKFDPLLGHSVKASKRGSGNRESSSSRLAEGNTGVGSSTEAVCPNTIYYLSVHDRPKEAWARDANRTDAGQGYCNPKRAVGTMEMIQKASEMRQAKKAELLKKMEKLAKEIREEEAAAEALKK